MAKAHINLIGGDAILVSYANLSQCFYVQTCESVNPIAEYVGHFFNAIDIKGKVICVGVSMGANVCAMIAKTMKHPMNRIVGLDPTSLLFDTPSKRLNPKSAKTVVVIHTSAIFGTLEPWGTVDYYMNNRYLPQPYCIENICSHLKAIEFYYALVSTNINPDCPADSDLKNAPNIFKRIENSFKKSFSKKDKTKVPKPRSLQKPTCNPGLRTDQTLCTGNHTCIAKKLCSPFF